MRVWDPSWGQIHLNHFMVFRSVALCLKPNSITVSLTRQVYKHARSRIKVGAFLIHVKPMVDIPSLSPVSRQITQGITRKFDSYQVFARSYVIYSHSCISWLLQIEENENMLRTISSVQSSAMFALDVTFRLQSCHLHLYQSRLHRVCEKRDRELITMFNFDVATSSS